MSLHGHDVLFFVGENLIDFGDKAIGHF